jgi:MFS family permease
MPDGDAPNHGARGSPTPICKEQRPARSRGLMSGILQGSWGSGFLLSSAIYGLFYDHLGWRGMLWIGIVPALSVVYIRYFVKGLRFGPKTANASALRTGRFARRC